MYMLITRVMNYWSVSVHHNNPMMGKSVYNPNMESHIIGC